MVEAILAAVGEGSPILSDENRSLTRSGDRLRRTAKTRAYADAKRELNRSTLATVLKLQRDILSPAASAPAPRNVSTAAGVPY